jgi:hypothetical protein
MVYSMKNEIPGLMDPSVTVLGSDHVMQSNSVLLFYGEREVDDDGKLVLRLVDVESFVRPLIVVPDFDPTFNTTAKGVNIDQWIRSAERKNSFIVVRPRDLWHLTFLELAQEHYDSKNTKNKKKSKTTIFFFKPYKYTSHKGVIISHGTHHPIVQVVICNRPTLTLAHKVPCWYVTCSSPGRMPNQAPNESGQ